MQPSFLIESKRLRQLAALGLAALLGGCGSPFDPLPADATADLPAIEQRGYIRFGRKTWAGFDSLPHEGLPLQAYYDIAEDFAAARGLEPRWVRLDDFLELLDAAAAGQVDVVVNNMTITESRALRHAFTVPLTFSEEWLVGHRRTKAAERFDELSLGVPEGTSFSESVAANPELVKLRLERLPSSWQPDEVAEGIVAGRYDLTVMDAGTARPLIAAYPELERLRILPGRRELAWVARQKNPQLLAALNKFLSEQHFGGLRNRRDRQDLPGIKASGTLRMLTITGPHTFFLWRGELLGFEYELLKHFAKEQGVRLEVVLAPDQGSLFDWLEKGRADVLAAAVTVTEERRQAGLQFTRPYLHVDQVLVGSAANPPPSALSGLGDRRIHLNPLTSHWQLVQELLPEAPVTLVQASTEVLLERVRAGDYDLTVADSHLLAIEQAYEQGLMEGSVLVEQSPIAWVVHPEHEELRLALDDFTERYHRSRTYNLLVQKYFGNERRVRRRVRQRIVGEQLSPYDALVKKYSAEFEFDWRMVVAQMYQESGFDPQQRSFAGARGLMQVMPRTAKQVGVRPEDLWQPEDNILAGLRYLQWTRERFENSLPPGERQWFALAAYNAGAGHVRDARRLARERGWNQDLWFGNVEQAMLLLSEPEHANRAQYGFVRGREPVNYVRNIRERYRAYVDHLNALQLKDRNGEPQPGDAA